MSIAEWTELSAVMDRISDLKSQAQAAAVAGDFATAADFFGLVKYEMGEEGRPIEMDIQFSNDEEAEIFCSEFGGRFLVH